MERDLRKAQETLIERVGVQEERKADEERDRQQVYRGEELRGEEGKQANQSTLESVGKVQNQPVEVKETKHTLTELRENEDRTSAPMADELVMTAQDKPAEANRPRQQSSVTGYSRWKRSSRSTKWKRV